MAKKTRYIVFNRTDGFVASPDTFASPDKAEAWIVEFRKRFETQGYYLTSSRERIDPADVELEVLPHGSPFM